MAIFGLTDRDVERIRKLLNAYEQGRFNQKPTPLRSPTGVAVDCYIAVTEEAVPANGSGSASLHTVEDDGTTTDRNFTITIWNLTENIIPAHELVYLIREPFSGRYVAIYDAATSGGSGSGEEGSGEGSGEGCGFGSGEVTTLEEVSLTMSGNTIALSGLYHTYEHTLDGCEFSITETGTTPLYDTIELGGPGDTFTVLTEAELSLDQCIVYLDKTYTTFRVRIVNGDIEITEETSFGQADQIELCECECFGSGSGSGSGGSGSGEGECSCGEGVSMRIVYYLESETYDPEENLGTGTLNWNGSAWTGAIALTVSCDDVVTASLVLNDPGTDTSNYRLTMGGTDAGQLTDTAPNSIDPSSCDPFQLNWRYTGTSCGGGDARILIDCDVEEFSPSDIAGMLLWLDTTSDKWQDTGRTTPADDTDPVGAWDDISGNALHVTEGTNKPTSDEANVAVDFDGADVLSVTDAVFDFTDVSASPFTILAWVKIDSFNVADSAVVTVGTSDFGALTFSVYSDGGLRVIASTSGSGWEIIHGSAAGLVSTGTWALIHLRRDTAGLYEWGVNGSFSASHTNATDILLNNNTLKVGSHYSGVAGASFDGDIGAVLVYDSALSTGDVVDIFNSTGPNA